MNYLKKISLAFSLCMFSLRAVPDNAVKLEPFYAEIIDNFRSETKQVQIISLIRDHLENSNLSVDQALFFRALAYMYVDGFLYDCLGGSDWEESRQLQNDLVRVIPDTLDTDMVLNFLHITNDKIHSAELFCKVLDILSCKHPEEKDKFKQFIFSFFKDVDSSYRILAHKLIRNGLIKELLIMKKDYVRNGEWSGEEFEKLLQKFHDEYSYMSAIFDVFSYYLIIKFRGYKPTFDEFGISHETLSDNASLRLFCEMLWNFLRTFPKEILVK